MCPQEDVAVDVSTWSSPTATSNKLMRRSLEHLVRHVQGSFWRKARLRVAGLPAAGAAAAGWAPLEAALPGAWFSASRPAGCPRLALRERSTHVAEERALECALRAVSSRSDSCRAVVGARNLDVKRTHKKRAARRHSGRCAPYDWSETERKNPTRQCLRRSTSRAAGFASFTCAACRALNRRSGTQRLAATPTGAH